MTIPIVPIIICVVGLLMYWADYRTGQAHHAKIARVGEIAFAVGLFWTVATLSATGSIRL